jgi:hypothetical protein
MTTVHRSVHQVLVRLLAELRPDLPLPALDTLLVEALDHGANDVLDQAWAAARLHIWPEARASARRAAIPYSQRRAAELEDAKPRPGDFPGRPRHLQSVGSGGDAA